MIQRQIISLNGLSVMASTYAVTSQQSNGPLLLSYSSGSSTRQVLEELSPVYEQEHFQPLHEVDRQSYQNMIELDGFELHRVNAQPCSIFSSLWLLKIPTKNFSVDSVAVLYALIKKEIREIVTQATSFSTGFLGYFPSNGIKASDICEELVGFAEFCRKNTQLTNITIFMDKKTLDELLRDVQHEEIAVQISAQLGTIGRMKEIIAERLPDNVHLLGEYAKTARQQIPSEYLLWDITRNIGVHWDLVSKYPKAKGTFCSSVCFQGKKLLDYCVKKMFNIAAGKNLTFPGLELLLTQGKMEPNFLAVTRKVLRVGKKAANVNVPIDAISESDASIILLGCIELITGYLADAEEKKIKKQEERFEREREYNNRNPQPNPADNFIPIQNNMNPLDMGMNPGMMPMGMNQPLDMGPSVLPGMPVGMNPPLDMGMNPGMMPMGINSPMMPMGMNPGMMPMGMNPAADINNNNSNQGRNMRDRNDRNNENNRNNRNNENNRNNNRNDRNDSRNDNRNNNRNDRNDNRNNNRNNNRNDNRNDNRNNNNSRNNSNNHPNMRPGDWICIGCDHLNFAFRDACGKCKAPKPKKQSTNVPAQPTPQKIRPGDWLCSTCSHHNYSFRKQCERCGAEKTLGQIIPDANAAQVLQDVPRMQNNPQIPPPNNQNINSQHRNPQPGWGFSGPPNPYGVPPQQPPPHVNTGPPMLGNMGMYNM